MMARLDAERTLGRISEIAAGTGSMKDAEQRAYLAALRRTADGPQRVQKANVAMLAELGIAVHKDGEEVNE